VPSKIFSLFVDVSKNISPGILTDGTVLLGGKVLIEKIV
jgi:hypothetical protein